MNEGIQKFGMLGDRNFYWRRNFHRFLKTWKGSFCNINGITSGLPSSWACFTRSYKWNHNSQFFLYRSSVNLSLNFKANVESSNWLLSLTFKNEELQNQWIFVSPKISEGEYFASIYWASVTRPKKINTQLSHRSYQKCSSFWNKRQKIQSKGLRNFSKSFKNLLQKMI